MLKRYKHFKEGKKDILSHLLLEVEAGVLCQDGSVNPFLCGPFLN